MEDEVEVGVVAMEAMAVEVAVATIMGTIGGTKDEVLLRGTMAGMKDGVEDEVLLRTTVVGR